MARLVGGEWSTPGFKVAHDAKGRFLRDPTSFRQMLTEDEVEPGRFHLYASFACPWASRALVVRRLLGLEGAVSVSIVDPFMGDKSWRFSEGPGCDLDTVNGKDYLYEIYLAADAEYTGRITVPVLWDKKRKTIVNNESREIIRMFDTVFRPLWTTESKGFCPEGLESRIDETIDRLYMPVNNGVYRSGFAKTQEAYEEAVTELFAALDHWESVLADRRYLLGDQVTEADWCLFTTLVRFDVVYHYHFKCNLRRVEDYPNLSNYLRDLYQLPGVKETVRFDHIKQHYFRSHESINPRRIVPLGPAIDLDRPHDRRRLTGE